MNGKSSKKKQLNNERSDNNEPIGDNNEAILENIMHKNNKHIDKNFQDKLKEHEFELDDRAWNKMETLLDGAAMGTAAKGWTISNGTIFKTVLILSIMSTIIAILIQLGIWQTAIMPIAPLLVEQDKVTLNEKFNENSNSNENFEKEELKQSNNEPIPIAIGRNNLTITTINQQNNNLTKPFNPIYNDLAPLIPIWNQVPLLQTSLVFPQSNLPIVDTVLPSLTQHLNDYTEWAAPEKVYLQLDRTLYKPTDAVWFTGFVRKAGNLTEAESKLLYIELIAPNGSIAKSMSLPVKDGIAAGDFQLNEDMAGGIYTIKAFTNWQKNTKETFERKIQVQKTVLPNLNMVLDFERKSYGAGDKVSAKLTLANLKNEPLREYDFVYSASLNGNAFVKLAAKTDKQGRAILTFDLPTALNTNDGLLNVMIPYNGQTESIARAIPIVLNKIDVQFFAEGGDAVENLSTKLAFKALNEFGKPADIEGIIQDENGKRITTFKSYHQGMGGFDFTYQKGKMYKAILTNPRNNTQTFDLPKPLTKGVVLEITKKTAKNLTVTVQSTKQQTVYLVAQAQDKIYFSKKIKIGKKAKSIKIPTTKMPIGMVQLTVLDENELPQAERLAFINKDKQLQISIQSDKPNYQPREQVTLTVSVKDADGTPIAGNFGLSIVDEKNLSHADDKQGHILSEILIQSDVKGKVEEPNFYFETPSDLDKVDRDLALDYLLMTQGWRRFDWTTDVTKAVAKYKFNQESDKLGGQLIDQHNQPIAGALLMLHYQREIRQIRTNETGRFEFENVPNAKGSRLEIVAVEQNNKIQRRIKENDRKMVIQILKNKPTNSNITMGRYTKKTATGQTGIQGKLLDANGEDPILFANVVVFYTNTETAISGVNTDLDGNFKLLNLGSGLYDLEFQYVGYQTKRIRNLQVQNGKTLDLKVYLAEDAVALNEVVVTGYRVPMIQQDNTTQSSVVTARDIQRLPTRKQSRKSKRKQVENANKTNIDRLLAGKVAGVAVTRKDDGVNIRGSRADATDFYVDGVKVSDKIGGVPAQFENEREVIASISIDRKSKVLDARKIPKVQDNPLVTTKTVTIPAQYENIKKTVLKTPATTKTVEVPAEYQTLTKQVVKTPAYTRTIEAPAIYKTVTKQVEVKPATTAWTKRRSDKNCLSANPDDCLVWCLVEIAAKYETVTERVLVQPAGPRIEVIPAEYEIITERVLSKAAATRLVAVPAEYETVKERKEVSPAKTETVLVSMDSTKVRVVTIPAQYRTVQQRVLLKAAHIKLIGEKAKYGTVTERKEVKPATTRWVKRRANKNCMSSNPDDCLVWCLIEVPAEHEIITKTVLKEKGTNKSIEIPAEYATIGKQVLTKRAEQKTINVPKGFEHKSTAEIEAYLYANTFKKGRYKARKFYTPKYEAKVDKIEPTVRNDFRTTTYWNPTVAIGEDGKGTVTFYNSDAVTAFRVTVEGFATDGQVGRQTHKYFTALPFSMSAKVPTTVLTGDKVAIPLTLTNNTKSIIKGRLSVKTPTHFKALAVDLPQVEIQPEQSRTLFLNYEVGQTIATGDFEIRFDAGQHNDVFTTQIETHPRGFPVSEMYGSNQLEETFEIEVNEMMKGSMQATFSVHPTVLSDLVSGLDRMLRQPRGCFEQTSSSNYPNVLALNYMQETGKVQAKIQQKAKDFIKKGYDRLKTFEVEGGGFDWYGRKPAHEGLTAYGLMQFVDMQSVYEVEQSLIDRTAKWLLSRRNGKGSWNFNKKHLHSWNGGEQIRDAYIVWALTEADFGQNISKEIEKSYQDAVKSEDPYVMGLMVNALLNIKDKRAEGLLNAVLRMQQKEGNWNGLTHSITQSRGKGLKVETTSLVALALIKANGVETLNYNVSVLQKAIQFIASAKNNYGFGSTQSTVLALKALVAYAKLTKEEEVKGTFQLFVDGKKILTKKYTATDSETMTFDNLGQFFNKNGKHTIEVKFKNTKTALPYDVAINYATRQPKSNVNCQVNLKTKLQTTHTKMGETVRLTATLQNTKNQVLPNTIAMIGIPSGLTFQPWQLKDLQEKNVADYIELFDGYVVFHYRHLDANAVKTIQLDLKADIPGQYEAPASSAYLYYTNEFKSWSKPKVIIVQ